MIWICIPVFNRKSFTLDCLKSIYQQDYCQFKVVLCDHGSTDGTSSEVSLRFPEVVILKAESSLWWTGAINRCIEYALKNASPDDTVLTLNNDTELPYNFLTEMMGCHQRYKNSIITSMIQDIKTGRNDPAGYRQNWWIAKQKQIYFEVDHLPSDKTVVEVSHASGRGTLFPVLVFRRIGLFDELHLPHYAADYDFTFKAVRSGFKVYACQNCIVKSHVEATGMTKVITGISFASFYNYFFSIRSPAYLTVRWWYGWNNCPKYLLPTYLLIDFLRILGGYFKQAIKRR